MLQAWHLYPLNWAEYCLYADSLTGIRNFLPEWPYIWYYFDKGG